MLSLSGYCECRHLLRPLNFIPRALAGADNTTTFRSADNYVSKRIRRQQFRKVCRAMRQELLQPTFVVGGGSNPRRVASPLYRNLIRVRFEPCWAKEDQTMVIRANIDVVLEPSAAFDVFV
jgi:hypothetical protein